MKVLRVFRPFIDLRLWVIVGPAIAVLFVDPAVAKSLLYTLVCMLVIVGITHLLRKVMFPYIDMETFSRRALETSQGAAIVALGMSVMIASAILGTVWWMRG